MNHVDKRKKEQGFTLIELSLALAFIAILLLTIALTIIQIATIYNRGSITKELNTTSRALDTELSLALRSSGGFSLEPSASRYVPSAEGGRLCLGQYSYIWNYGRALSEVKSTRNMYVTGSVVTGGNIVTKDGATRYEIGFVKVPDSSNAYCTPDGQGRYKAVVPTNATELLRTGDHGLVLHSLKVETTTTAKDKQSGQQLYRISYTLGTDKIGALNGNATTPPTKCLEPGQPGADFNYCAIQQFTLVLRVVSGFN